MELYKLKDQVQQSVDYAEGNPNKEIFSLIEVSKDMLICPTNQSIPEKYFKELDCDIATTTRRAYLIGITEGDIVMTYTGPKRKEVLNFVLNYAEMKSKTEDIRSALRDDKGDKGLVYAPIKNGIEIAIYGPNQFYCNNDKLTEATNVKKTNANVSIDSLVNALEKEFNIEALLSLPKERESKHVENMRGILRSCGDGRQIFDVKKKDKTFRIRCPMVFDEIQNANVPKTSLLEFGGLNNTIIKDGFYEGDLEISYQEDEFEETIKFLEEKGEVEWLDGQPLMISKQEA